MGQATLEALAGRLESPRRVGSALCRFALDADFDGDGHRDLAIATQPDALNFYPGNGDFTFDPRITFTTGARVHGAIASDLNGDGRPDVAVATRDGHQVNVFVNAGGFNSGTSASPPNQDAGLRSR